MNSYISRTKGIIENYLTKAMQTREKISEGRKIYNEKSMEQEEKRLNEALQKERKAAEEKIDAIYREASAGSREWGKLDGAKLTADAQLLQGQGVTPEQFAQLVERYQDNYTMLDALRKYGAARNAEAVKAQHAAGEAMAIGPYNVDGIPGPDAKMQEWEDMRKRATHFLNCADGTGFSSEFSRTFAIAAADKEFEAWGTDEPEQQRDPDAAAKLADIWGFHK